LKDFGVIGQIRKLPLKHSKRRFFLIILTAYRFDWNKFAVDRTKPEVAHFLGAKKKVRFKMVRFQWFLIFSIHFLSRLHVSSFNAKAFSTAQPRYSKKCRGKKIGTYYSKHFFIITFKQWMAGKQAFSSFVLCQKHREQRQVLGVIEYEYCNVLLQLGPWRMQTYIFVYWKPAKVYT